MKIKVAHYPKPMSNEEFKARIKAICGPLPKADRPCVRTPNDRGYYPPPRVVKSVICGKRVVIINADGAAEEAE